MGRFGKRSAEEAELGDREDLPSNVVMPRPPSRFLNPLHPFCGPLNTMDGVPSGAVDNACKRHDEGYAAYIKAGLNPYVNFNRADEVFISRLRKINDPIGLSYAGFFLVKRALWERGLLGYLHHDGSHSAKMSVAGTPMTQYHRAVEKGKRLKVPKGWEATMPLKEKVYDIGYFESIGASAGPIEYNPAKKDSTVYGFRSFGDYLTAGNISAYQFQSSLGSETIDWNNNPTAFFDTLLEIPSALDVCQVANNTNEAVHLEVIYAAVRKDATLGLSPYEQMENAANAIYGTYASTVPANASEPYTIENFGVSMSDIKKHTRKQVNYIMHKKVVVYPGQTHEFSVRRKPLRVDQSRDEVIINNALDYIAGFHGQFILIGTGGLSHSTNVNGHRDPFLGGKWSLDLMFKTFWSRRILMKRRAMNTVPGRNITYLTFTDGNDGRVVVDPQPEDVNIE